MQPPVTWRREGERVPAPWPATPPHPAPAPAPAPPAARVTRVEQGDVVRPLGPPQLHASQLSTLRVEGGEVIIL